MQELEQRQVQNRQQTVSILASKHEGPLPAPEVLQRYKETDERLFALIVAQFQEEGGHRRDIERRSLEIEAAEAERYRRTQVRGQLFAFLAIMSLLVVAGIASWKGQALEGLFAALFGIGVAIWGPVRAMVPRMPEPPSGKPPADDA